VGEVGGDLAVRRLVGVAEVAQRLVREHDTEAEGVVGPVALDDLDVRRRKRLLQEDRRVESRGPAADHVDAHLDAPSPGWIRRRLPRNYFKSKVFRTSPHATFLPGPAASTLIYDISPAIHAGTPVWPGD